MSTATDTPQFVRPPVEPGDPILFHRDLSDKNGAGIGWVIRVGRRGITAKHGATGLEYEGIRHIDNPELRTRPDLLAETRACWSEAPLMKRLRALEGKLAEFEKMAKQIADLTAIVQDLMGSAAKRKS
jgi:hypothetical protein